jgi:eukaryotic-like serine/threonine-protein kinase
MMKQPSWIGHTLGGRYRLEKLLGQGGMSAVYRAEDPNLRRPVAIKLIHSHLASDPQFVRRFEEEAAAVAQLRHPNIVQVYDFSHDGDTYYMVLEFVPGDTLYDRLHALNSAGQRMPLDEVIGIATTLCEAVDYAHQRRMIHRDLKPANVMITPEGQPILMDFGIVKIVGGDTHTATGAMIGTVAYMAPEQIRGERADQRTDIYALGVMLFEMVSGQRPFQGDSAPATMMMHLTEPVPDVRKLNEKVPPALAAVIEKAMAKAPDQRYQTAGEMAVALADAGRAPATVMAARAATGTAATAAAMTHGPAAIPPATAAPSAGAGRPVEPPPPVSPGSGSRAMRPWFIGGAVAALVGVVAILCGALFLGSQLFATNGNPTNPTAVAVVLDANSAQEPEVSITAGNSHAPAATPTEVAVEPSPTATLVATPTPTAQPTATDTPQPTATFAPTATQTATAVTATSTIAPTAVPATPTTASADPAVRITRIDLSGDRYAVYYETIGYTPNNASLHIHFFFNTVPPANAGNPGSGPWKLYDLPVPFMDYGPADRPDGATQMCALVANHDHSIRLGTGNCVGLP